MKVKYRMMQHGAVLACLTLAVNLFLVTPALMVSPRQNGNIAFESGRDDVVKSMGADGSGQTRLTNNAAFDVAPTFSPDGSKIAFSSARDDDYNDGNFFNFEIYVMNADGSGQTRLTNNDDLDWTPAFSPDGSKIAFTSHRDGNWDIYVMNANGSGQTRPTNN
jgi:Tol biopolymer transport system component